MLNENCPLPPGELDALTARLEAARRDRGAARLAGGPVDSSAVAAIESEIEALDDARAELSRRERAAAQDEARKAWDRMAGELRDAESSRIAAVARAEAAAEELVGALRDVQDHAQQMTGIISRMGQPLPLSISLPEQQRRLSCWVVHALRSVQLPGRFGVLALPSLMPPSPDGWPSAERKALEVDIRNLTGED